MTYFKVTHTAQDRTGQEDLKTTNVSQFELQDFLLSVKGECKVEKIEDSPFNVFLFVVKIQHAELFTTYTYTNKEKADQTETQLIHNKHIYKKFILSDKL